MFIQVHHDLCERHPDYHRLDPQRVDRASSDERRPLEFLFGLPRKRKPSRLDRDAQVKNIRI